MKTKLILLLLLLTTSYLQAQIVNIPDPNFLLRLLKHTAFGGMQIDTNYNNQIEVSEAEALTKMYVGDAFFNNYKIVDMTGIEAFINLTKLECYNNEIEVLDLSQNTLLEYVDCMDNNIYSLNVTGCTALVELICSENELSTIDMSSNTALERLWLYENFLNSLSVSQNLYLDELVCSNNNISSLDVSQNTLLKMFWCNNNNLSNIDTTYNIILEEFGCSFNEITSLDLSQNHQLKRLIFGNNLLTSLNLNQCVLLEYVWVGGNQLTNIDLSQNPNLRRVRFESNQLTSMNIRNNNNENIGLFDTTGNPLLTCIFVDDTNYSTSNWTNIDTNTHFVETQTECDAVTDIADFQRQKRIRIFPNPAQEFFIIDTTIQYDCIYLYDSFGKQIIQFYKQKKYTIKDLPTGVYYIKIKTPQAILIKKLLKQ